MWLFTISIVLAVFALLAIFGRKAITKEARERDDDAQLAYNGFGIVGAALAAFSALALLFASTTIVSTKNVGVLTTFGRPGGTIGNGLHLKAPWQRVTELDGAIQIDNHTGDRATKVRLGNNSAADVDNSVRWRIVPAAADGLFLDYRDFSNIRDNLVTRELNAALNEVLSGYNPLAPDAQAKGGADLDAIGKSVTDRLRSRVGDRIEVLGVIIPLVRFDQTTQQKIDAYQAEIANTRIAEQRQRTAAAEAEANRQLSQSVNNDPNVLVSKCLDIVKASGQSPLGCWPGGAASVIAQQPDRK